MERLSIDQVQDLFIEVTSAVELAPSEALDELLVPNYSRTMLYRSGGFLWGGLWELFWWAYQLVVEAGARKTWYAQTVTNLSAELCTMASTVEETARQYIECTISPEGSEAREEETTDALREQLRQWIEVSEWRERLAQQLNGQSFIAPLAAFSQLMEQAVALVRLELLGSSLIPIDAVSHLIHNAEPDGSQLIIMQSWLEACVAGAKRSWGDEELEPLFPTKIVHKGLQVLIDRLTDKQAANRAELLPYLELLLEAYAPDLFSQADPEALEEREGLQSGAELAGEIIDQRIVGEHPKELENDRFAVFSLRNSPQLILVGSNSVYPGMVWYHSQCQQEKHKPFSVRAVTRVPSDDRLLYTERLLGPLTGHPWAIHSGKRELVATDKKIIDSIASAIGRCIAQKCLPANITLDDFMWDAQGGVVLRNPPRYMLFSYLLAENICWEVSQGDAPVLKRLMKKSGLLRHPTADIYRKAVVDALEARELSVEQAMAVARISDIALVPSIAELTKAVCQLRDQVLRDLLSRRKVGQTSPKALANQIVQRVYTEGIGVTRLVQNSRARALQWTAQSISA